MKQLHISFATPNHFIESGVRDGKFKTVKKFITLRNCVDAYGTKRLLAAWILPEIGVGGSIAATVLKLAFRGEDSDLRFDDSGS